MRRLPMGLTSLLICLVFSCAKEVVQVQTFPIKLGTFTEPREHGTKAFFISSPWNSQEYLSVTFPEHCWGINLPNTSHDSKLPVMSPWRFNADSTAAEYERSPREGVLFRASARVDSTAVRMYLEITNDSDTPIENIRTLVCLWPYKMESFRDTNYSQTYVAIDNKPARLGTDTHYHGDLPDRDWGERWRSEINWGVNIAGGLDNRTLPTVGWFRGNSPGRIVEEEADPALIAIHSRQDKNRWLAIIWNPARVLFCNPGNPCFHSDPQMPDCPPGGRTTAEGVLFFHNGSFESLISKGRNAFQN
jgi:hypothetical protein